MDKIAGYKDHSRCAIAFRTRQYALYLGVGGRRYIYLPVSTLFTLVIVENHCLRLWVNSFFNCGNRVVDCATMTHYANLFYFKSALGPHAY